MTDPTFRRPGATDFEFRFRFFLIFGSFILAIALSAFDSQGAAATLAGALKLDHGQSGFAVRAIIAFGAGVVAAGAWLRTWATAYLRADIVHDASLHAGALVADGPYRHVRNPLYLGVFLVAIGVGLALSRLGYAFIIVVMGIYLHRLIRREESELRETQGESYARYCAAVPSFIPALTPRLPLGGARPRWSQAIRGELFVWVYVVAQLAYAGTGSRRLALSMVAVGFVLNAIEVYGPKSWRAA